MTWATQGRHPIALDEPARRRLIREITRRAGAVLASWCVVDDHVHLVFLCDRDTLIKVLRSLRYLLGACGPIAEPHIEPVTTRKHAVSLVGYVLTQPEHHGLGVRSAAWSGSCLADLLGARDTGWAPRLWASLPRLKVGEVHAAAGLPPVRIHPATDEDVRAAGPQRLVTAAAAAFAAEPALTGRAPEVTRAIWASATLAREVGLPLAEVARAAGRARETVSRAGEPPRGGDVRTLRRRIAFERIVEIGGVA